MDHKQIPRYSRYRPDFLSPGPRVHIAADINILKEESQQTFDDEEDEEERTPIMYYQSQKVLGRLFRQIDEGDFLFELKQIGQRQSTNNNILDMLWGYVERQTVGFAWDHLIETARNIKSMYEMLLHLL